MRRWLLPTATLWAALGLACSGATQGGGAPAPDDPSAGSSPADQRATPEPVVEERVEIREEEQEAAAPQPAGDPDGDGVAGSADLCPHDAEDPDGDRDGDGCPDRSLADAPVAQ